MKTLGFAAILVSVCAMAACTVNGGSGSGGAGGDDGEGGSDASTTTSSTTTGGGEGGEGGGDVTNECTPLEFEECVTCCQDANSAEVEALTKLTFWHCGCEATIRCAQYCDTTDEATDVCGEDGVVNMEVDNLDCETCVIEESAPVDSECYDAAYTACGEADDCQALTACSDTCE
ncbi:hypothetical protein WME76_26810 [Sorangium sp. So ce119]|uniref:hypothetical protein n=1 Tax=Sorangium sp. So ce119 TaxID=3133279 RepID=UPI003F609494